MNWITCVWAFIACIGFSFLFEVRRPVHILAAAFCGFAGWAVYLLAAPLGGEVGRYLLATVACSLLAELFARLLHAPATLFLIISIVPLVPGGGLYYTMEALINGDHTLFMQLGIQTAACAAAIAAGVSLVSSLFRILTHRGRSEKN